MANQNQEILYHKHFINGQFADSKNGKTYANYCPFNGRLLTQIADGDQYDINYAVDCAKRAYYAHYRKMDASKRGHYLYKLADLIEQNIDIFVNLEILDHGKPHQFARDDIYHAIRTFRYYAGYADKLHGKTIPADGDYMTYTRYEPYGVVGLILPCNNPFVTLAWKLAPALATGNCVVIKPGYQTPLTALYLAYLTKQVGYPDGIINFVCGDANTGRYLVAHQDIRKIFFCGKFKNGKDVMENAAHNFLKQVHLSLGSNNPLVVFNDYDVDQAARIAYEHLFHNMGQYTSAAHRLYVQEDMYDEFVRRVTEYARNLKIVNPFDQNTKFGPLYDEKRMNHVLNFIELTKKEGAHLKYGGKRHGTQGFYVEPTIFTDCTDHMKCAHEELYGPVMYIFKFKNYEEVRDRLNKNYFGMAAGVLTKNLEYSFYFTKEFDYGNVWINDFEMIHPQTPYGGYKNSGCAYDLGIYGLYNYLQTKTVTFKTSYDFKYKY